MDLAIIPLVTGILLIASGLIVTTENTRSSIMFKFIPVALGLVNVLYAVKLYGWMVSVTPEV